MQPGALQHCNLTCFRKCTLSTFCTIDTLTCCRAAASGDAPLASPVSHGEGDDLGCCRCPETCDPKLSLPPALLPSSLLASPLPFLHAHITLLRQHAMLCSKHLRARGVLTVGHTHWTHTRLTQFTTLQRADCPLLLLYVNALLFRSADHVGQRHMMKHLKPCHLLHPVCRTPLSPVTSACIPASARCIITHVCSIREEACRECHLSMQSPASHGSTLTLCQTQNASNLQITIAPQSAGEPYRHNLRKLLAGYLVGL